MRKPRGMQLMEEVGRWYEAAALCRSPDTGLSTPDDWTDLGRTEPRRYRYLGLKMGG